MMSKYYEFPITLGGWGDSEEEAWSDAVRGFIADPGPTPRHYTIEGDDDEAQHSDEEDDDAEV